MSSLPYLDKGYTTYTTVLFLCLGDQQPDVMPDGSLSLDALRKPGRKPLMENVFDVSIENKRLSEVIFNIESW